MKTIPEGFPGQRLLRVPEEILSMAATLPLCRDLRVTDLGHFPETARHEVRRSRGIPRHIVILCVAGEGWFELDGGAVRSVPPQGLLVIPAGVPHAYGASSAQPWRLYWVHVEGERSAEMLDLLMDNPRGGLRQLPQIAEICEAFETLWRVRDDGGSEPALMRMSAEVMRLLVLLHASVRSEGKTQQRNGDRVERALFRMRKGLAEPLCLSDLAWAAGVSLPHFCALFKAATGVPPMTYFTRLRMRHAAEWLDGSDEPIASIGRRVGYENAFHFTRAFHRSHGLSPRAYRQRVRG